MTRCHQRCGILAAGSGPLLLAGLAAFLLIAVSATAEQEQREKVSPGLLEVVKPPSKVQKVPVIRPGLQKVEQPPRKAPDDTVTPNLPTAGMTLECKDGREYHVTITGGNCGIDQGNAVSCSDAKGNYSQASCKSGCEKTGGSGDCKKTASGPSAPDTGGVSK